MLEEFEFIICLHGFFLLGCKCVFELFPPEKLDGSGLSERLWQEQNGQLLSGAWTDDLQGAIVVINCLDEDLKKPVPHLSLLKCVDKGRSEPGDPCVEWWVPGLARGNPEETKPWREERWSQLQNKVLLLEKTTIEKEKIVNVCLFVQIATPNTFLFLQTQRLRHAIKNLPQRAVRKKWTTMLSRWKKEDQKKVKKSKKTSRKLQKQLDEVAKEPTPESSISPELGSSKYKMGARSRLALVGSGVLLISKNVMATICFYFVHRQTNIKIRDQKR